MVYVARQPPAGALGLLASPADVGEMWLARGAPRGDLALVGAIALCGSLYGAAMGAWRDPLLALFVAVKLPLLFLSAALVAALANGMWARWLGLDLSLHRSLRAVLMAFALASVMLAACAPVVALFALTLPNGDDERARFAHDGLGLLHVAIIALAGSVAVRRQSRWIAHLSPGARGARAAVGAWLVLNLVVGAQLAWNLRPWFGSPGMPVTFLRERPFDGTFYESVLRMILHS